MADNVLVFPTCGKAITLNDAGMYYTVNTSTGKLHSVFQLVYEDDWYLCKLQNDGAEEDARWAVMTESNDYTLYSMTTDEIRHHFSKPEYAEPKGAWQVMRNSKFGFGKFTPLDPSQPNAYAILIFTRNEMHMPMLVRRLEEEMLEDETPVQAELEFA
jgi:hypothetical protein